MSVNFATVGGGSCDALAENTSGTLTFTPGVTTQTVRLIINNCSTTTSGAITFNLSAATNASIARASTTVTINPVLPTPTVTGVSPASGPTAGGTTVTITGTNFTGATQVLFGGIGGKFTVVSATSITATAPADTAGAHNVQVVTPSGTSAKVTADDFTYLPTPTVTGVSPASGPTAGGTTVTITGTNFTGATQVLFGGIGGKFTVVSATSITATAPADTAGAHNVQVVTPSGTSAKVTADDFTYS